MTDVESVKAVLRSISSLDDETIDAYTPLIENAVAYVNSKSGREDDGRATMLAAARANYSISLVLGGDGVTGFKAGDVSITQTSNASETAKQLLISAEESCSDIMSDSGFAFRTV